MPFYCEWIMWFTLSDGWRDDKRVYKECHLVEYFNGNLKQFRRVFSQFDKWPKNFMNFVRFAATLMRLC
uniref:Transposase DDE domain-containing protein n=1 Tax=Candidatus Kentrum eta TaxID=2126337 RepID=A0A450VTF4_9GAMM|nr:MAG: hypothetical protein BECKH772A_GA0070896_107541 [Candidatus Kentron sp. H]VFK08074.1 MAG: hypothetical protein BECKH772B_GA0070898_108501 [Candidatus Kentron sp. H]VFK11882.1 MAG: hypothetical protein BECKH772C_GA0070978_108891 [Candidatus Kentron sp. H]